MSEYPHKDSVCVCVFCMVFSPRPRWAVTLLLDQVVKLVQNLAQIQMQIEILVPGRMWGVDSRPK